MTEITKETFDIVDKLKEKFPELSGYYARGTGGLDVNHFIKVLGTALLPSEAFDVKPTEKEISPERQNFFDLVNELIDNISNKDIAAEIAVALDKMRGV